MKSASLVVLAALLVPAIASAQPSARPAYPPPPPPGYAMPPGPPPVAGGFHDRAGRLAFGGSIGLGQMQMNDSEIGCTGCDVDPISFEGDAHLGWMVSPRLALLLEVQAVAQPITDTEAFTETLTQTTATIGAQYWVTPQLWIKGGIGGASLTRTYDDGWSSGEVGSIEGGALMGAVGYEVFSARNFAVDLQLRATGASYEEETIDGVVTDTSVSTTTLGVGINWY